ncbi:unnamed protein product, partial [Dicrocoelium dendriticum]
MLQLLKCSSLSRALLSTGCRRLRHGILDFSIFRFKTIAQGTSDRIVIGTWLASLSGMTLGAVLLGGATRLTESGLSMVDWHPFKEVPPSSEQLWLEEFNKYKQFPEYNYQVEVHGEMSLSRFKFIWYMEYAHRMWGRFIGAVYAIPAAYFLYRGSLNPGMKSRVFIYGCLIGVQGLLGWLMVRSGLKECKPPAGYAKDEPFHGVPRVDHLWLCAHLSSAVILYCLFYWGSMTQLVTHPPV